jgi:FkbM family methyltransferase
MSILVNLTKPLLGKGLGNIPGLKEAYGKITQHTLSARDKIVDLGKFKIEISTKKRGLDGMSAMIINKKSYEPMTSMVFDRLVKKGNTVIDIGANIGYYSLLSRALGAEKVFAIEPEWFNCQCLVKNIMINRMSGIFVLQVAASDVDGSAELFISDSESGEHSLEQGRNLKKHVPVTTITIDTLKIDHADLVKIDTEGHEWKVLDGGKRILDNTEYMIIEFWPPGIEAAGHSAWDMWGRLEKMFKHMYVIDEIGKKITIGNFDNALKRCNYGKFSVNVLCSKTNLNYLLS